MDCRRTTLRGAVALVACALLCTSLSGCLSAKRHGQRAERAALASIDAERGDLLESSVPFQLDPQEADELDRQIREIQSRLAPNDLVSMSFDDESAEVTQIGLTEAMRMGARNSREFQGQREDVFLSALRYELAVDSFRLTVDGMIDGLFSVEGGGEEDVRGLESSSTFGLSRRFRSGLNLSTRFTVDFVKLLTMDEDSAMGLMGDVSATLPLLRGAGRERAMEPVVQAQRDLWYAIYGFDQFKQEFVVRTATDYLGVLQQIDSIKNSEENYRGLVLAGKRAQRMADAGRLPEIQVDQATQDELRARERWINALAAYERRLDAFKLTLGFGPTVKIRLDRRALEEMVGPVGDGEGAVAKSAVPEARPEGELRRPVLEGGGPFELPVGRAVELALANRLDLRIAQWQEEDAERAEAIARNDILPRFDLSANASAGEGRSLSSADQGDGSFRVGDGNASVGLEMDLPWERTEEAIAYRTQQVRLERARRSTQELRDQIVQDIRNGLRNLLETRESMAIQEQAVVVARRRVESTSLYQEAGRAQIRDVLEAQEALISAQNALVSARVRYRVAELELQRNMGLLTVADDGNWNEYEPDE